MCWENLTVVEGEDASDVPSRLGAAGVHYHRLAAMSVSGQ